MLPGICQWNYILFRVWLENCFPWLELHVPAGVELAREHGNRTISRRRAGTLLFPCVWTCFRDVEYLLKAIMSALYSFARALASSGNRSPGNRQRSRESACSRGLGLDICRRRGGRCCFPCVWNDCLVLGSGKLLEAVVQYAGCRRSAIC